MKKIALIPNEKRDIDFKMTRSLVSFIVSRGCRVIIDEIYREKIGEYHGVDYAEGQELFKIADEGFVLGGDGSILRASRNAAICGLPLLGINLGHLGYIAELEISELSLLDRVIEGDYVIEYRMMLDVQLIRNGNCIQSLSPSLNDAVISNGPVPRLLSTDLYCNGKIAGNYRSDGLIIATPTGSTAYSMSAGGPILDPSLECLCVTPISSHSLTARPIIFNGECVIELKNMICPDNDVYLTSDGKDTVKAEKSDIIRISRSKYRTGLIRLKNRDFLTVLHNKMV